MTLPVYTTSDLMNMVTILNANNSAVQGLVDGVTDVRQAHSYLWDDAAGRTAEIGMTHGSHGVQRDTNTEWTYNNTDWKLTGGLVPTLVVEANGNQAISHDTITDITSIWNTPTTNYGFTSWSSGVLTIMHTGIYLVTVNLAYNANDTGRRQVWVSNGSITSQTDSDFIILDRRAAIDTGASAGTNVGAAISKRLAATTTLKVVTYQNSGGALSTNTALPEWTTFTVRYMGPS